MKPVLLGQGTAHLAAQHESERQRQRQRQQPGMATFVAFLAQKVCNVCCFRFSIPFRSLRGCPTCRAREYLQLAEPKGRIRVSARGNNSSKHHIGANLAVMSCKRNQHTALAKRCTIESRAGNRKKKITLVASGF